LKFIHSISLFLLTFLIAGNTGAQVLTGIATQWNDSFREWEIYSEEEDINGDLTLRWRTGDDWTEWQYQFGDHYGTIKQKWSNDPSQWEIRGDNQLVTMRAIWKGDFRHWRISGPDSQFDFECNYGNTWDEWKLKHSEDYFIIYTNWTGDPREWIIEEDLDDSYSFTEKMAMAFLAIYHSSPRE
jgi:hypothetical protein